MKIFPQTTAKLADVLLHLANDPKNLAFEEEDGTYILSKALDFKYIPHKQKGFCFCNDCCAKRITESFK